MSDRWRQALGQRTLIMGVLNVTPDSFSDGGRFADTRPPSRHAHQMAADGADILDIGGESTRPATFGDKTPLPSGKKCAASCLSSRDSPPNCPTSPSP